MTKPYIRNLLADVPRAAMDVEPNIDFSLPETCSLLTDVGVLVVNIHELKTLHVISLSSKT